MQNTYFQRLESLETGQTVPFSEMAKQLVFNAQGLIPVITQEAKSGQVLMMAWMNSEALMKTLETRKVTYWSRSRNQLWIKGETSGHHQRLVNLRIDCDGDTLLCLVEQTGPACHTKRKSCFYFQATAEQAVVIDV